VVHFRIPPLGERRDEIAPLSERFLGRYAEEYGKSNIRMSDETNALQVMRDMCKCPASVP